MYSKFIFPFLLIWVALIGGYIVKRKGYLTEKLSNPIIKTVILFGQPIIICLAFWVVRIPNIHILTLPLVGLVLSILLYLVGKIFSDFHKHNSKDKGAYLSCCMFSNIGLSLGGFICFLLFGEQGLGLAIFYSIYSSPLFYTVGFYIARFYAKSGERSWIKNLKSFFNDPLSIVPNVALIVGLILNFSNIARPQFFTLLNNILIPLTTFLYMFSIGLTIKFAKIKKYFNECLSISFLKFIINPIIGLSLAYLFVRINILDTLSLKVIFIESAMPVAISSLILSSLFKLNKDLTNSCWVFTTFITAPWISLIYWIMKAFG